MPAKRPPEEDLALYVRRLKAELPPAAHAAVLGHLAVYRYGHCKHGCRSLGLVCPNMNPASYCGEPVSGISWFKLTPTEGTSWVQTLLAAVLCRSSTAIGKVGDLMSGVIDALRDTKQRHLLLGFGRFLPSSKREVYRSILRCGA